MYLLNNTWLEQINIAFGLGHKPGMDSRIRWLNPLLHKCGKRLYQDARRAVKRSGTTSPDKFFQRVLQ